MQNPEGVCVCEELPIAGRSLWLGLSWKGGCIAEEPAKESRFAQSVHTPSPYAL